VFDEVDRTSFTQLADDQSFGRVLDDRLDRPAVLRAATPGFPNAPADRSVWFAGRSRCGRVGGGLNPPPEKPVTIRARVSWDGAWRTSCDYGCDDLPPDVGAQIPQVVLHWEHGNEPPALGQSAAMERALGKDLFEPRFLAALESCATRSRRFPRRRSSLARAAGEAERSPDRANARVCL